MILICPSSTELNFDCKEGPGTWILHTSLWHAGLAGMCCRVFSCVLMNLSALFINLNTLMLRVHWAGLSAPAMFFEAQIVSDFATVSSHVHGTQSLPSLSTVCREGIWTLLPKSWTGSEALVPLNKKIVFRNESLDMPHTLCLTFSLLPSLPPFLSPSLLYPPFFSDLPFPYPSPSFLLQISFTKKPLFSSVEKIFKCRSGCLCLL